MANRDGTGPLGQGPLTGRGLGPCGAGFGFRRGFGRGIGRGFFPVQQSFVQPQQVVLTADEEKKALEAELQEIEAEKVELQKRLKELKA